MHLFPNEIKCPECGKIFLSHEPWGYVRKDRKYCSYKCARKQDKETKMSRINGTTKRMDQTERAEVDRLLSQGEDPRDIAQKVGVTIQAILYYKNRVRA